MKTVKQPMSNLNWCRSAGLQPAYGAHPQGTPRCLSERAKPATRRCSGLRGTFAPIELLVVIAIIAILPILGSHAAEPAAVTEQGKTWTLRNESLQAAVTFSSGNVSLTSFYNREAKVDYLKDRPPGPLFSHVVNGQTTTANDGGWTLSLIHI